MAVLCGMPTIQYSAGRVQLYLIGGLFLGPTRVLNTNGISIASAVLQCSLGYRQSDRPTKHATRSVTKGGIHVRSTVIL